MFQGYQPIIQQIESDTYAGTAKTFTTKLNKLQEDLGKQHQHLIGLLIELDITTLTLSSGTVTPDEANLLFDRIEFNDGRQARFVGTGKDLAVFERIESGGRRVADPITTASGSTMQIRRYLSVAPPRLDGSPSDFAIPNAMLGKGFLSVRMAAMTAADANITVLAANYKVAAVCVAMDELRIPPFIERKVIAIAAEDTIPGERLVAFLALGNDAAWGTIAAGDFGSITIKTGKAEVLSAVDSSLITASYNQDMFMGMLGGAVGDPRSAGDLAAREVNPATPSALQAAGLMFQPAVYCQPSGRLTKIPTRIARILTIKYSGANTGTVAALTSVLPQTPENVQDFADQIADLIGEPLKLELKLRSKSGGANKKSDVRYLPYALVKAKAA